jgi:hypothetical protein
MMAELKNLTENNVTDLKQFFAEKISPSNPEASIRFTAMADTFENAYGGGDSDCKKEIKELKEKVEVLSNKINHIFGDSFLYNGEFVSVKDQKANRSLGL